MQPPDHYRGYGTARYEPPYDPATDPWNSPHNSPPTTPHHSDPPPAAGGPGQHTDPAQPQPADGTSAPNLGDTKPDAPQPAQRNTQDFTGTVQGKAMPAEKCTMPSMHEPNTEPLPSVDRPPPEAPPTVQPPPELAGNTTR